jgi:hypothetical protein
VEQQNPGEPTAEQTSAKHPREFRELPSPDWHALIPELKDWNGGDGIDAPGWIDCSGNFQLAVGYSQIFWPRFVEHDGMILREGFNLESLEGCVRCYDGDKSAVEAMMNHKHIADIHYCGCPDATHERLIHLGRVLQQIYECKIRCQFPERDIVVEFDDSPQEDLISYQLTFYQRRNTN